MLTAAVVSEQQDLVGVQLFGELSIEVVGPDEAALQHAGKEGAGAGERVPLGLAASPS